MDLAGLKAGERVLVHAAAGGVGMAAVQLATHLGAEVFATASPSKWQALRAMGLDDAHIASSRARDFCERFLEQTDGRGVDVVLDALAGELVDASLALLPNGGRYIEMGKTDIRDPPDRPSPPGRRLSGVRFARSRPRSPPRDARRAARSCFRDGALTPLPVTAWDIRHAPDAFRYMSHARHTGKIILTLPATIDPHGTILITGGTGVLGALVARHLVARHNAAHLLVAGRQGLKRPGRRRAPSGAGRPRRRVRITACDVSDLAQLAALIGSIPEAHPLRGVVHAAGALDDGVIDSLTPERLDQVMAPKADAAWHLHQLTKHLDLSMFVLFSSVAATFGSPGQGNYAAANAFLDALATHRQTLGLPATSMAWGQWAMPSAMTEHLNDADLARMARSGVAPLTSQEGWSSSMLPLVAARRWWLRCA